MPILNTMETRLGRKKDGFQAFVLCQEHTYWEVPVRTACIQSLKVSINKYIYNQSTILRAFLFCTMKTEILETRKHAFEDAGPKCVSRETRRSPPPHFTKKQVGSTRHIAMKKKEGGWHRGCGGKETEPLILPFLPPSCCSLPMTFRRDRSGARLQYNGRVQKGVFKKRLEATKDYLFIPCLSP